MGCTQSAPDEFTGSRRASVPSFDDPATISDDVVTRDTAPSVSQSVISPDIATRTLDNGKQYKLQLWERLEYCYLKEYTLTQLYDIDFTTCNKIFKMYDKGKHEKLDKRYIKKLATHCCIRLMYEYYITQKALQPDIPDEKLKTICLSERMYVLPCPNKKNPKKLAVCEDEYYIQCMTVYLCRHLGINKQVHKCTLNKFNTTFPNICKDLFDVKKNVTRDEGMNCVIQ